MKITLSVAFALLITLISPRAQAAGWDSVLAYFTDSWKNNCKSSKWTTHSLFEWRSNL
jgi:hypothetical protein